MQLRLQVPEELTGKSQEQLEALAVDDCEVEPELLPHFRLPLERERRRADHHPAADAVSQEELLGDQARLVMVLHAVLESRFAAAIEQLSRLEVLRSPPRAIRVLEEEFG